MKTIKPFSLKKSTFLIVGLFLTLFLLSSSLQAQDLTINGIVKGKTETETTVLNGANIFLKGTRIGTTSNKKGEFTFPKSLKVGDILVFSYLGFEKKSVKIKSDSKVINIILVEDESQMFGALNSNKRFSSNRKKQ